MRAFMYLFAVLFLFTSQASFADKIYRWTDAEGQVHFGSQPPQQDNQAEEVKLRVHKPSSPTDTDTTNSAAGSEDKSSKNEVNAEESVNKMTYEPAIDPEVAARNCRIAKEQKKLLSENFNRRFQQPDGSVRPLSDAERTARMKQMDDVIKQYCY